ncbi:MAG: sensor histidine kinase [Pseudonocardiales bacterium]|nr:sensor histidine kinase [Pseudonocardiales bacterium]
MGEGGAVDTSQGGELLAHEGLLYGSEAEFLAGTVPFIRDGLERGDPIRIATTDRNTGWLRAALGGDARRVAFWDSSQWYRHPVRALAALHDAVQEVGVAGQRLRIVREPSWTASTAQESKEWARHESVVNAALAWANAALLCAYDTSVVDPAAVASVARTHPELVVNGGTRPSPAYTDPAVFNAECNRSPLPELPPPTLWLRFRQLDQLVTLRAFVTSHATQIGAHHVEQFVQAVDEVVTNAVEHGGGSGVLQIWTGPQTMMCEVSDTGAGLLDPLAGHLPPDPFAARGRGLWLARQFSDLVELHSDPAGTTVRLHLIPPCDEHRAA